MRTVQTFNLQDFQIRYEDTGIHAIGGREVRIIPRFRASLPVASSPFTARSSSPLSACPLPAEGAVARNKVGWGEKNPIL